MSEEEYQKIVTPYVVWGYPEQRQLDGGKHYLTYKNYCKECEGEGDKPVGKHRFQSLMMMRGLVLALEDKRKNHGV